MGLHNIPTNATTLVASRIGYDVSNYPLGGPAPPSPPGRNSQTFLAVVYEMGRREDIRPGAQRCQPVARFGEVRLARTGMAGPPCGGPVHCVQTCAGLGGRSFRAAR